MKSVLNHIALPHGAVAQAAGLLYRRLPACEATFVRTQRKAERPADWQSAIRQTSGLRYN